MTMQTKAFQVLFFILVQAELHYLKYRFTLLFTYVFTFWSPILLPNLKQATLKRSFCVNLALFSESNIAQKIFCYTIPKNNIAQKIFCYTIPDCELQQLQGGQPIAVGSTFSLIMHPLQVAVLIYSQHTGDLLVGGGGGVLASGTPSIVASVYGRGQ
jgi:hypothetical protein